MNINIKTDWSIFIQKEKEKHYFKTLLENLDNSYKTSVICPIKDNIFAAFNFFNVNKTQVVIIGQDPYPTPGRADGLAFSFGDNKKAKDSLKNIFVEMKNDLNIERTKTKLDDWAQQGVLLINSALTFNKDSPKSHKNKKFGWVYFINNLIKYINENTSGVVFVLWGNDAKSKEILIDKTKHFVITSSHPSNIGGSCNKGFFGSKPFSKINSLVKKKIIW
ncbi:MAG: uracil-DNA glycosylase [Mycoplasmataceae bacterium]|nr:uracil-DNA glycosylase [Mycoplasmataceae bacterium]